MTNDRSIDPAIQAASDTVKKYLTQGSLLERGLNHNEIWELQRNLNKLGFTSSQADGAFGPATASDVMGYLSQPSNRALFTQISPFIYRELLENGQGELLKTRMADQVNNLISGTQAMSKNDIERLQRGLEYATGRDVGTVDGKIGKQTLNILHDFIREQDREMLPHGQSLMLELNGNLLIGAEDETIDRFQSLLERAPRETRINWLHDYADAIRGGDAQKNTAGDNGVIAQGQLMLRSLGYDAGNIDGMIGAGQKSQTRAALEDCLRDNPENPKRVIERAQSMASGNNDTLRSAFFSADQAAPAATNTMVAVPEDTSPVVKPATPLV